jgi:hypothetical protein
VDLLLIMDTNTAQEQSLPTTSSNGPKPITQGGRLGKRPFFKNKNKHSGPPAKRQMATFSKTPENKLSSVYPLQHQFELATTFTGVRYVSQCFYDILSSRDGKMTQLFSANEFYYIVLLSVYYRCATITNMAKTSIIFGLSDLKNVIMDILLPDAVATYVETFGSIKLSSDAVVIPYFRGINEMQTLAGFVDPVTVIRTINQRRGESDEQPYHVHGDWNLAPQIIVNYTKAISRALKNAIDLRRVNFAEPEGRPEFLSCYEVDDHSKIRCYSLDKVDQTVCQLGATYRLRNTAVQDFGVVMEPMFGAPTIEADVFMTNHFLKSLRTT